MSRTADYQPALPSQAGTQIKAISVAATATRVKDPLDNYATNELRVYIVDDRGRLWLRYSDDDTNLDWQQLGLPEEPLGG